MSDSSARFGLPPASLLALQTVLARHPGVLHADIYGSRAKGNFRPGSDIDLTLFGDALTNEDLLRIDREMDALDLPYKIDLSLFAHIEDSALRAHIERVGQVLYQRIVSEAGG